VEKVYGVPFSEISVSEKYLEMVVDKRIRKSKVIAREFCQTIAEIQFESVYPYVLFEDTANRMNPVDGRINMSNLCSEILQVNEASEFNEDLGYAHLGTDISCNLGSLNIAKAMDGKDLAATVGASIRALTAVSEMSAIDSVPSVRRGNDESHAIGLGQMNLHGFLAREHIHYGSEDGVEFTSVYFATIAYHAIRTSCDLAREKGESFKGFEKSDYASGTFFDKYTTRDWLPQSDRVAELFEGHSLPTRADWEALKADVMKHGLYNRNLQAVPPTGSISYINNSTSSIHPIVSKIEIRKEGKIGRV
jgi:ribonucleoside-diphosphate reductase alpha chain